MRINGRDLGFMAIVGIIIAILVVNSGRERPGKVPSDKRHRHFLNALSDGKGREKVEKGCPTCHNVGVIPLPKRHPPKEQCLFCHAG